LDRKTCDPFIRYVLPAVVDEPEHQHLMTMALINPPEIPQCITSSLSSDWN